MNILKISKNLNFLNFNKKYFTAQVKQPLKIKSPKIVTSYDQYEIPFCIYPESSIKKLTPKGYETISKRNIRYSGWKLNLALVTIRGQYLRNAVAILKNQSTKGAHIVLNSILKRLEEKNKLHEEGDKDDITDEVRSNFSLDTPDIMDYKVVEAFVGMKNGHSIPTFRGKGKVDMITRPICHFTIRIQKVFKEEYFKEVAIGKADRQFAADIRAYLWTSMANLRDLKDWSFVTTAKGRYIRRQQFNRLVFV